MPSDARKLSDWLRRQAGALQEILSPTEQLVQANRAFRDWLREPWAESVRIVGLDGDTVVVYAANAAAATLLRFRAPAIVAFVQERWNPACTSLQIKVQPET
ncbi:MAG: DciA family protein [Nevskiaceae bacterium]